MCLMVHLHTYIHTYCQTWNVSAVASSCEFLWCSRWTCFHAKYIHWCSTDLQTFWMCQHVPCVPLAGIWLLSLCRPLLVQQSPPTGPCYSQFCQSCHPVRRQCEMSQWRKHYMFPYPDSTVKIWTVEMADNIWLMYGDTFFFCWIWGFTLTVILSVKH